MNHLGSCRLAITAMLLTGTAWAGREDRDFDGDRRADLAVYHAAAGDWYVQNSGNQAMRKQNWGWNRAQPVVGDFDGDGRADFTVYNGRGGEWYTLQSGNNAQVVTRGWGSVEQEPISGDFDGDGRNDLALYHPTSGLWSILKSSDRLQTGWQWGFPSGEPVPGDYDGDGRTDCAIYERASGNWWIRLTGSGRTFSANWGWRETEPAQADYDGDGRTDLAVYHPVSGDWFLRLSNDGQTVIFRSGWINAQPVPADFNGDGRDEPAIYAAAQGMWVVQINGAPVVRNWGWSGAEAACGAYRVDDDSVHHGVSFGHDYDDDAFERNGSYPRTGDRPTTTPNPPGTPSGATTPVDLGQVNWLHADVSGWAQTSKLRVKINKSTVSLSYDKAGVWPGTYSIGGATVAANPWIFVPQTDGTGWDGATWEWMKQGQTSKNRSSVAGDHIKKSPLNNFKPVPGQWYGFMVSGLARDRARNVSERSNVVMVQWPADGKESQWFE